MKFLNMPTLKACSSAPNSPIFNPSKVPESSGPALNIHEHLNFANSRDSRISAKIKCSRKLSVIQYLKGMGLLRCLNPRNIWDHWDKISFGHGWQRVIVLFHGYQSSPYWSPNWICTQRPACQWSRTSICCHNMWFYLILRAIPAIHETNALREVLWQRVGKFQLKSTTALFNTFTSSRKIPVCWNAGPRYTLKHASDIER